MDSSVDDTDLSSLTICGAYICCISSCNCNFPSCIGWRCKCNCLCFELFSQCGCIAPYTCCSRQRQVFCVDQRCAFPCTDAVPYACSFLPFCLCFPRFACCPTLATLMPEDAEPSKLNVDPAHLTVCIALMCIVQSIYCKIPDCIGCAGFDTCCCLHVEYYRKVTCETIVCIKSHGHCFCCDSRCAIPCDEDIAPVACTLCPFWLVYPMSNAGCCVKFSGLGHRPMPYPTMAVAVVLEEGHVAIPVGEDHGRGHSEKAPVADHAQELISAQPVAAKPPSAPPMELMETKV
ncbi:hypothetical protein CTAYLR_009838 [Chrysophaeum taylorii]|uniref:Uncharacterized protein n=1 Tax=Chrysophaeum taylorii TaxID=2483200 RepID=A0AAD7XGY5_9STRA|nr:hypothetical protein CTAYLR_009838 [Chrysophaeum taylorii]